MVERVEYLVDIAPGILFGDLGGCQSQELFKVNPTRVILVQLSQNLVHKLVLPREAQIDKGLLKLRRIDHTTAISIENIKSLLDLDNLILWQQRCNIVAGIELLLGLRLTFSGGTVLFHTV